MINKLLLKIASIIEVVAGVGWIIAPGIIVPQVIGGELTGVGVSLGRLAGFGLVSLAAACWPWSGVTRGAMCGMLTYNALTTAYLAYVVIRWGPIGKLLIPSLVVHAVLTLLLGFGWLRYQGKEESLAEQVAES